ncbi:ABC transporter ATP-binding protein [Nocardioides terrisoli]|uniref:ABC transporter ATP-binding protein n=1 Tax=Nocardioides terrisoli TaxID=3388267 RepID=UPI00287B7982|nr:ABC transporter ATP-binding protein [Nocardioides marmorisolisilvae]
MTVAHGATGTTLALEAHKICKTYGEVVANDHVSLAIPEAQVLAILGENGAGKSTLMSILCGLTRPDSGEIRVKGTPRSFRRPEDAQRAGIGMVHQHFMLVNDMTVAENIALTRSGHWSSNRLASEVKNALRSLSEEYDLHLEPDAFIKDLSVGQRQRVEIAKLLCGDFHTLIFDEPSAVLTEQEWRDMGAILKRLSGSGKSIVIVTHKLAEAIEVASQCAVLRNGRVEGVVHTEDVTTAELARMMVGRDVSLPTALMAPAVGDVVFRADRICLDTAVRSTSLKDVSFSIRRGEIFGVAGVDGNGQTGLVRVMSGMQLQTTGCVALNGHTLTPGSVAAYIDAGGAVIPEDRQQTGLNLAMSVADNLISKDVKRFTRAGILRRPEIRMHAEAVAAEYGIVAANVKHPASSLSGGNQQKIVIARELGRPSSFLIASQPTRGLDLGAVEFVYKAIERFRTAGGAVLLISSDLDEILTLSDRIAVMSDGHLSQPWVRGALSKEEIGLLMTSSVSTGEDVR